MSSSEPPEQSPRRALGMSQDEYITAMATYLLPGLVAAIRRELFAATRTCMNCEHWLINSQVCGKFDNQLPPPHIIAHGCNDHEEKAPF